MDNKSLLFTYTAKDEAESNMFFLLPPPMLEEPAALSWSANKGKGWQKEMLDVTGLGRHLSYRNCNIQAPTVFTSKVSEPVISLSLRWGSEGSMKFSSEPTNTKIDGTRHFLFWQGDRPVEQELQVGEHIQLDILIKPENLIHLKGNPQIDKLLEQSAAHPHGNIGELVIAESEELGKMAYEIVKEIDTTKPTVQRLHYLCDSLLLFALGEDIIICPPEKESGTNNVSKKSVSYRPKPGEQAILDGLNNLDRPILLAKYRKLFNTVTEKKKLKETEIELDKKLKRHSAKLWGVEKDILAGMYFGFANYFAIYHDHVKTSQKNKALFKKVVVKGCDLSFAMKKPNPVDLAFYMKWSQEDSPSIQPLDSQQVSEFLSILLPNNNIDFTKDQSRRGQNLLMEQVKEAFGLLPMSDVMGIKPEDKPKEIVDLYNRLTEYCVDMLELDEKSGVKRSDIVREVDSAYELDDYISLLQIEIEFLCTTDGYLEKQDDERLKWLIVALKCTEKEYNDFFKQTKTDPNYKELRLFHKLDNNINKFKAEVRKQIGQSLNSGVELGSEFKKVAADRRPEKVLEFAKFMLEHEGV